MFCHFHFHVMATHVLGATMAPKQWPYEHIKAAFFSTFHLSIFCLISALFVFKLARRTKSKSNINLPPSPPKLPIIGNLHQIGTLPHRSFRDLSHKYGDVMLLQLGNTPTLVVSSPDAVKEMMKTHDLAFANRPLLTAPKFLLYGHKDIVFAPYGESWRQKKKIAVSELLSPKRVQSVRVIREEEVAELVSKLREIRSSDAWSVNLSEMVIATSNNIVCRCALGQKYSSENGNPKVKELARKVMIHLSAFTVGDLFPLLGWIDVLTGQVQEFKATFRDLDALFDQVIADHVTLKREGDYCSNKKDFVDILLQLQEDGMLDFDLSKDDLKALLMDMFVGGSDTVAATLEWAIAELVNNPIIMKKAQEEVRRVVGLKSKVEDIDVNQMDYLKCVVKETLRLRPPAPLMAPRETLSNVKLKGYDIPAKTMVYVNAWAIHRDPKIWERPEDFLPERYEKNQVDFKGQDFQFIPFGFGRRGCPGMTFGVVSIEYMLANLLYWFDWKQLVEANTSAQDMDMTETYGLVVSKKVPLHLKPTAFSFQSKF